MPVIRQIRKDKRRTNSNYLETFAKTYTSQHGEDGIIEKIFEIIGEKNRWCVEFGAWDGVKFSNTNHLINDLGWSSIQIEGNRKRFEALLVTHGENKKVHCMHEMVGFTPKVDSIETYFARTKIPLDFDLLVVDIDGNDYHIWDSIMTYRPRVVIIEFNRVIPNDVVYIQDRDFSINHSSSLLALILLGRSKGYELVCASMGNAYFVYKEDYPKFDIENNDIDEMNFPHRDAKIFCLIDGTLVNVGLNELRLRAADPKPHKVDPFEFQVYSASERGYAGAVPKALQPPKARPKR